MSFLSIEHILYIIKGRKLGANTQCNNGIYIQFNGNICWLRSSTRSLQRNPKLTQFHEINFHAETIRTWCVSVCFFCARFCLPFNQQPNFSVLIFTYVKFIRFKFNDVYVNHSQNSPVQCTIRPWICVYIKMGDDAACLNREILPFYVTSWNVNAEKFIFF